ncbi:CRASP family complement regulator-acquiring lipoprotein [Borreliella garinii]|uniref:Virulent strain associated lipoprotein n=1 Tax=Borreliella garinii PBr TaxID=498743 RepID=B8F120_BORGR|nr:CRASP family complement regulator-acquiring lipoprotein [Borreliella garinii]ACL34639.1 virulent strain associated lipoprotein [Borreliella garinii PBr]
MKYLVIINVFFLLFLACNPDFDINKKNIKPPSSKKALTPKTEMDSKKEEGLPIRETLNPSTEVDPKEEALNKKIKNKLLNDLNNLIEAANAHKEKYIKIMEKEPDDQYGMAFGGMKWRSGSPGSLSDNSEKARKYRRNVYTILSNIDTKDLKEFSDMLQLASRMANIFNHLYAFGDIFDIVTDQLYSEKDALDELDISDLEKLKQSLEKVLSIIKIVSEESKQLLLDYKSDKNSIKTDVTKLTSQVDILDNQMEKKVTEAENLQDAILLIWHL